MQKYCKRLCGCDVGEKLVSKHREGGIESVGIERKIYREGIERIRE